MVILYIFQNIFNIAKKDGDMLNGLLLRTAFYLALAFFSVNILAKDTLVIGTVSINPKKHFHTLKPMANYVVSKMKDLGIKKSKVIMARDNNHMIQLLKSGEVDWVTETPFSAIAFEQQAAAELLLLKRKKGVLFYHTVFFTRKDSGINALEQLIGKSLAFEDSGSTSAYYAPASELISRQLPLFYMKQPREDPPADKIGYSFSGSEINTASWVHIGIADVGAFSNLDWEKEESMPLKLRNNFKIIYRTKPFPRAIELVRKELPVSIKRRLKHILLNAHLDKKGKKPLYIYQKTSQFDVINADTNATLDHIRETFELVNQHLK